MTTPKISGDSSSATAATDVLERNVETLLEAGGDPPRMTDLARARIRAQLLAAHARPAASGAGARMRTPAFAIGLGLAAVAAGAIIATRLAGTGTGAGGGAGAGGPGSNGAATGNGTELALADGSTVIPGPDGHVDILGARHVRVSGRALLDVAPGKGTFVVETARGTVEVLGTRFLVDANDSHTLAAVVRGEVKLATDAGAVTLHAGEQGVAERGRVPTRGPAPRLSMLTSWARAARRRDEGHDVVPLRNGTLFAREPNRPWLPESPLPIAKLTVDVVVEDQVARVALDQTFHNPAPIDMEGMYRFAIPLDAALQRLAMYNHGKLVESAVVERMSARRIYEDAVYRRVDPALLEWAGTGRLALRVYPLPAQQDKRLVLAYTQSLPALYDDWTLAVPMPELDQPVGELAFDVRIKDCGTCELTSTSHQIAVRRDGADAVVHYAATHARLGDSLVLHVRDPRHAATIASAHAGSDDYLLVRAPADLHAPAPAYHPRTWVILDDVSASRDALAVRAQADLIDAFLRELDEHDRVAVLAFDVAARPILAPTRVLDVDRAAVRAKLHGEPGGVGATDFGAALTAALSEAGGGTTAADTSIIYLGDGVITAGPRTLDTLRAQLAGKATFVGVGVGDGPDTQTLDALAAATGGYSTTIDLADDLGWRAFDLVAALHTARVTGVSARLVGAHGEAIPAAAYLRSAQLADGEQIELVAKIAEPTVVLSRPMAITPVAAELTGTLDGAPWQRRIAFADATRATGDAGFVPRLWAQRHIAARLLAKHEPVDVPPCTADAKTTCPTEADLREARDETIRKDIVELGKRYFLLSRHTSLLVLEDDAMYARYGVTKGVGDTWAPYALPATIPVPAAPSVTIAANVADSATLERTPLPVFYDPATYQTSTGLEGWAGTPQLGWGGGGIQQESAHDAVATRMSLGLHAADGPMAAKSEATAAVDKSGGFAGITAMTTPTTPTPSMPSPDQAETKDAGRDNEQSIVDLERTQITSGELGIGSYGFGHGAGTGNGYGVGGGRGGLRGRRADIPEVVAGEEKEIGYVRYGINAPLMLQRFTYPTDVAFDDVTEQVPALFADGADSWRVYLAARSDGKPTHAIDDAARTLLTDARAHLPTGVYRWDGIELAVDAARHLGWRRTTDADLVETASLDGTTLTRRYAELGLDVTRPVTADDVGMSLAYLPVLVADPAQWARWFDVRAHGPHEVALMGSVHGKPALALVLAFDDADHLIAIRDADGRTLIGVTWTGVAAAATPTAATIDGRAIAIGFTGQAIADATTWAHGSAPASAVVVELPGHLPAYWRTQIAAATVGDAAWRRAERQRMAADAATQDRHDNWLAYGELLAHGGVELGDLVLASGGIATATTDAEFARALAPWPPTSPARPALVRYLAAGRAYGHAPDPSRFAHDNSPGLLGALSAVREISAQLAAGHGHVAADHLLALGDRASGLRLVAAAAIGMAYQVDVADQLRAWDSVATGAERNIARIQAVTALYNHGDYDRAAQRIAELVADDDLAAPPAELAFAPQVFAASRRGSAGWQLAWATLRDHVLAAGNLEHVVALLPLAAQQPTDVAPILARAAELAAGDPGELAMLARLAISYGQPAWAQTVVDGLIAHAPSRALDQLDAQLLLSQGRNSEALAALEAAQDAGADEAVDLSVVRAELGQIIGLARAAALQTSGAARDQLVARALHWGERWRAIDPGNPAIDTQLGALELAVGNRAEAWRQLSTVIERDPMSGDGYATVADAFEAQGRVAEALDFWQQAIVIDQTNPTPRLRKAKALYALGRTADGDALLDEIAARHWHPRWANVTYEVESLRARNRDEQQRQHQQR